MGAKIKSVNIFDNHFSLK